MLPEVERRGGATPLTECNEFRDAFRRRLGVAERDKSRPLEGSPRRLREEGDLLRPWEEGDRSRAGLYVELGERAGGGVAAEGEVERESCLRDCRSSPSDGLP